MKLSFLDASRNFARGQALDLAHGQPFYPPVQIREGDPADYADAQLIVLTAGAKQQPSETRLKLAQRNARIIRELVTEIVRRESSAILLVVSNPVDVLTHVAWKQSGWPRKRVLGSGTVLDSARFRYLLSRLLRGGRPQRSRRHPGRAWRQRIPGMVHDAYCRGSH